MVKPTVKAVVEATSISKGYVSDILTGRQQPSVAAAVHIYRCTGWRHDSLRGLSDEQIDTLAQVHPWKQAA